MVIMRSSVFSAAGERRAIDERYHLELSPKEPKFKGYDLRGMVLESLFKACFLKALDTKVCLK